MCADLGIKHLTSLSLGLLISNMKMGGNIRQIVFGEDERQLWKSETDHSNAHFLHPAALFPLKPCFYPVSHSVNSLCDSSKYLQLAKQAGSGAGVWERMPDRNSSSHATWTAAPKCLGNSTELGLKTPRSSFISALVSYNFSQKWGQQLRWSVKYFPALEFNSTALYLGDRC